MSRVIDLTGLRFNKLTVIRFDGISPRRPCGAPGQAMWLCRCACGSLVSVRGDHLRDGSTRSCGCFKKDNKRTRMSNRPAMVPPPEKSPQVSEPAAESASEPVYEILFTDLFYQLTWERL